MKTGWHMICGYNCFVLDNRIIRVSIDSGTNHTYAPRKYNKKSDTWDDCSGISLSAFRRGILKGTIEMW